VRDAAAACGGSAAEDIGARPKHKDRLARAIGSFASRAYLRHAAVEEEQVSAVHAQRDEHQVACLHVHHASASDERDEQPETPEQYFKSLGEAVSQQASGRRPLLPVFPQGRRPGAGAGRAREPPFTMRKEGLVAVPDQKVRHKFA